MKSKEYRSWNKTSKVSFQVPKKGKIDSNWQGKIYVQY